MARATAHRTGGGAQGQTGVSAGQLEEWLTAGPTVACSRKRLCRKRLQRPALLLPAKGTQQAWTGEAGWPLADSGSHSLLQVDGRSAGRL